MAKGNRGGKRSGGIVTVRDYDDFDQMYQHEMDKIRDEMAEEERQLDDVQKQVDAWLSDKNSDVHLDKVKRPDGEFEALYLEKDTKKSLIDNYVKEYNKGLWDEDEMSMHILYKDGSMVSTLDAPNKFKTTTIDSIIINGSWGTTFCGKVKITHDVPDEKFSIVRGGGTAVKVGNSIRRLPKYNSFQAVWTVDFN